MLVILRPYGEIFEFLGSAYAHGAMNGEALPSESQDDAKVNFVLR
jgi:hypothetical protein